MNTCTPASSAIGTTLQSMSENVDVTSLDSTPSKPSTYAVKRQKRRRKRSPYARMMDDAKASSQTGTDTATPVEMQAPTGVFKKIDKI